LTACEVLGVSAEATGEEIRLAYVAKVKEHPPDRAPEEFERIREAYETLRDPRRRIRDLLFSDDPQEKFSSLLDGVESGRYFVGPAAWREVLKGK
jgi:DnaJ-class molecular chaperone